jgi:hypothetical protein
MVVIFSENTANGFSLDPSKIAQTGMSAKWPSGIASDIQTGTICEAAPEGVDAIKELRQHCAVAACVAR